MLPEHHAQAVRILQSITAVEWADALKLADWESNIIELGCESLKAAGVISKGPVGKPAAELVSLLGDRLMSDTHWGPVIREMLLRRLTPRKWSEIVNLYRNTAGNAADPFHGSMKQGNSGARTLAQWWRQGGLWPRSFCSFFGLPDVFATSGRAIPLEDVSVESQLPLSALHDFQDQVYKSLNWYLKNGRGQTAMLSLPTGSGKTRVTVEAIVDHLAQAGTDNSRNVVLWLADRDELLRQAWTCFRQVWQTPPQRKRNGRDLPSIPRPGRLKLVRAWHGKKPNQSDFEETAIVFAGSQQLGRWIQKGHSLAEVIPPHRLACVIIDEAHHVVAGTHRNILVSLNLRKKLRWEPMPGACPVIGLTATPWRTTESEAKQLWKYFRKKQGLITPQSLEKKPIKILQKRKILSRVVSQSLVTERIILTHAQAAFVGKFKCLPAEVEARLGRDTVRNGLIIKRLLKLPKKASTLVFACSVEHAKLLTIALNKVGRKAACVLGETPYRERVATLEAFRNGKIRFLCNCGVLTTGFDAPMVNVVCITKPTASALTYEQMVGRGLRGEKNGGTSICTVLDVQSIAEKDRNGDDLPVEIMSYARVLSKWEEDKRAEKKGK